MWWRLAIPLIWILAPRFIPRLARTTYLLWKLTFDSRVPLLLRLLIPASLIYFLMPFGLIPDFLPYSIGLIDDVILLLLAAWALMSFAPQYVVEEHAPWKAHTSSAQRSAEKDPDNVVEGSFHVVDEDEPKS